MEITMYRHDQMFYFRTADVLPGEDDGDQVLLYNSVSKAWEVCSNTGSWFGLYTDVYTHWMQMPKEPTERKVF